MYNIHKRSWKIHLRFSEFKWIRNSIVSKRTTIRIKIYCCVVLINFIIFNSTRSQCFPAAFNESVESVGWWNRITASPTGVSSRIISFHENRLLRRIITFANNKGVVFDWIGFVLVMQFTDGLCVDNYSSLQLMIRNSFHCSYIEGELFFLFSWETSIFTCIPSLPGEKSVFLSYSLVKNITTKVKNSITGLVRPKIKSIFDFSFVEWLHGKSNFMWL